MTSIDTIRKIADTLELVAPENRHKISIATVFSVDEEGFTSVHVLHGAKTLFESIDATVLSGASSFLGYPIRREIVVDGITYRSMYRTEEDAEADF